MGNTNGIAIFAGATGTVVRGNLAVGNPPIQVSVSLPGSPGVDLLNLSAPGTTTFERNLVPERRRCAVPAAVHHADPAPTPAVTAEAPGDRRDDVSRVRSPSARRR